MSAVSFKLRIEHLSVGSDRFAVGETGGEIRDFGESQASHPVVTRQDRGLRGKWHVDGTARQGPRAIPDERPTHAARRRDERGVE